MIDYKNLDDSTYWGPDFPAHPEFLNDYKNTYSYISEGMTFTFSIHWLISCLCFKENSPNEVTKFMFCNSPDFCDGASNRYAEICDESKKTCDDLKTDYLKVTNLFMETLSKWNATTTGTGLVNIDGKDVGKLSKLAEKSSHLLLTIYFNPSANESNDEISHTVAISKHDGTYYLFDPDLGVYSVDNINKFSHFIRQYFTIYAPHQEVNSYSSIQVIPSSKKTDEKGE